MVVELMHRGAAMDEHGRIKDDSHRLSTTKEPSSLS